MFALLDCNNFYASCERLFQPALADAPLVVMSNNDGCVIARTEQAKELGIKMGMPVFLNEQFFRERGVVSFSSNYNLYGSLSNRVMQVISSRCATYEVYSIDECFLYLEDMRYLISDYVSYAQDLRRSVWNVGIPVSIGVATTKTLAKMANRYAKKYHRQAGVFIIDSIDKQQAVLKGTSVADIWGIGAQYATLLQRNNITTASDLANAPRAWVRRNMTVQGERLWQELHGIPSIELEHEPAPRKNICVARSFGKLLSNKEDVSEALASYVVLAAEKLRRQDSCTPLINIVLQTNNFRSQDRQYFTSIKVQLPVPTNDTAELLHYASYGLERIWKDGYKYKKTGVMLLHLLPATQAQSGIFDQLNRSKRGQLMKALDSINSRWAGREMLKFASQGQRKEWKLRQEKLSPMYTTCLNDILTINI